MRKINLKFMTMIVAGSLLLTACGNKNTSENHEQHGEMEQDHSAHDHGESTEREVTSKTGEQKGDLTKVLDSYFSLNKNLVDDDASSAAESSSVLVKSLKSFEGVALSADEQQEVNEIIESATMNAEHIADNAGDIDHQREHLVNLSKDVKDLISVVGTSQKLYEDFCPMANNNEGAIWISQTEEINNPYMGSNMPKCGKVKSVIE